MSKTIVFHICTWFHPEKMVIIKNESSSINKGDIIQLSHGQCADCAKKFESENPELFGGEK